MKILWALILGLPAAILLLGSLIAGVFGVLAFFEANRQFHSGAPVIKLRELTDYTTFLALPLGALLFYLARKLWKNAVPWWSVHSLILALLVILGLAQSRILAQLSAAQGYSYCPALDKISHTNLRGGPGETHWDWAYTLPGKCPAR